MDGDKGVIADMTELGVWDPLSVKEQTFKSAIEVWVNSRVCRWNGGTKEAIQFFCFGEGQNDWFMLHVN